MAAANYWANSQTFVSEFNPVTHQGEDVFNISPPGEPSGSRFAVSPFHGYATGPFDQRAGGGPGWVVKIQGWDGYHFKMFHLHDNPANYGISEGGFVGRGQIVGKVGNSGNAAGRQPHVHFEIWSNATSPTVLHCPFTMLKATYSNPGTRGDHTTHTGIANAANQYGTYPTAWIGVPNSRCYWYCGPTHVHLWPGTSIEIQDFDNGAGGKAAIVEAANGVNAGVIWGANYGRYMYSFQGPAELGQPANVGGGYNDYSVCGSAINDFSGASYRTPARISYSSAFGAKVTWGAALNKWGFDGGPCTNGPPRMDSTYWYTDTQSGKVYDYFITGNGGAGGVCRVFWGVRYTTTEWGAFNQSCT